MSRSIPIQADLGRRPCKASPPTADRSFHLPAQNTSGNWVKVVQRIPVRIQIERQDSDPDLRAGMSVTAEIDTGYRRSWHDLF